MSAETTHQDHQSRAREAGTRATPVAALHGSSSTERAFSAADARAVRRGVTEARAVCRIVALAVDAMLAGTRFDDDEAVSRWHPSIEVACDRLRDVRSALGETIDAPGHDWFTPLNLLEALSAALRSERGQLDCTELAACLAVAVESLDVLSSECDTWSGAERASIAH